MSKRAADIDHAIRLAKQRDNHTCRVCGDNSGPVEGAHLLPRRIGFREYDPASAKFIVTLCPHCHRRELGGYDSHSSVDAKIEWLRNPAVRNGRARFGPPLIREADLVARITGRPTGAKMRTA